MPQGSKLESGKLGDFVNAPFGWWWHIQQLAREN